MSYWGLLGVFTRVAKLLLRKVVSATREGTSLTGLAFQPTCVLGEPVDGAGSLPSMADITDMHDIESPAPGIMSPSMAFELSAAGITDISRQSRKSTIAIDSISGSSSFGVYVAVVQIPDTVAQIASTRRNPTVLVMSGADDPATLQFIALGKATATIYDDLTKPAREAYQGDVFYLHSRQRDLLLMASIGDWCRINDFIADCQDAEPEATGTRSKTPRTLKAAVFIGLVGHANLCGHLRRVGSIGLQ